mmetsp:Transcript_18549/g.58213  ORF Transcript_18549/g.58213 Transcript_18549/m.58213 type:complete len:264 (-) Transcript_18549:3-794(-)
MQGAATTDVEAPERPGERLGQVGRLGEGELVPTCNVQVLQLGARPQGGGKLRHRPEAAPVSPGEVERPQARPRAPQQRGQRGHLAVPGQLDPGPGHALAEEGTPGPADGRSGRRGPGEPQAPEGRCQDLLLLQNEARAVLMGRGWRTYRCFGDRNCHVALRPRDWACPPDEEVLLVRPQRHPARLRTVPREEPVEQPLAPQPLLLHPRAAREPSVQLLRGGGLACSDQNAALLGSSDDLPQLLAQIAIREVHRPPEKKTRKGA